MAWADTRTPRAPSSRDRAQGRHSLLPDRSGVLDSGPVRYGLASRAQTLSTRRDTTGLSNDAAKSSVPAAKTFAPAGVSFERVPVLESAVVFAPEAGALSSRGPPPAGVNT